MNLTGMSLFDAHFHIIDPQFASQEKQGFLRRRTFTCDDYLQCMNGQSLAGGVVVSTSYQGFGQDYLLKALQRLGSGYVGVAQLPATVDDATLLSLDKAGVRGLRFNLHRGNSTAVSELVPFAKRVHELCNWHVELYADALLVDRFYAVICQLPAVAIDHLALSRSASALLLDLVERGVRIKASGFGRLESDPIPLMRDLYAANPACLMFGSDLPSARTSRSFDEGDLQRIGDALCTKAVRRVLCDNARQFYRIHVDP